MTSFHPSSLISIANDFRKCSPNSPPYSLTPLSFVCPWSLYHLTLAYLLLKVRVKMRDLCMTRVFNRGSADKETWQTNLRRIVCVCVCRLRYISALSKFSGKDNKCVISVRRCCSWTLGLWTSWIKWNDVRANLPRRRRQRRPARCRWSDWPCAFCSSTCSSRSFPGIPIYYSTIIVIWRELLRLICRN